MHGFEKMQQDGISLTLAKFVATLRGFIILEALDKGWIVHVEIALEGGSLEEAHDILV